jgi:hypothetical protein
VYYCLLLKAVRVNEGEITTVSRAIPAAITRHLPHGAAAKKRGAIFVKDIPSL